LHRYAYKEVVIVVGPIDELESLGISVKKTNDLNDNYELENLIENIKQTWIQDYKTCCSNKLTVSTVKRCY
jgi:hypothetical protein